MCPVPAHTLDRPPAPESAPEIEVTPEMIEAGLPDLFEFTHETHIAEETVAAIFRKMMRASRW
jgi:hypothetical protein